MGNAIEYQHKRYMIASMANNLRYSEIDVVLLEIAVTGEESGDWIITESGADIVTESGNVLVRRR
jgi:hypothetical protein